MNADLRQALRQAIDQAARQRRNTLIANGELEVCGGCGCDLVDRTTGCHRCYDRHTKRRKARA